MRKFYITTSIPYANAPPHIGHILDPLIADVLARYHRLKGEEVRFLVGSDEHGAKIVRTAQDIKKSPKELIDETVESYKKMHRLLKISWDDFIRTSDRKRHWLGAQKMWQALKGSGDIYWRKYRGLYCVGHEAFITKKDLLHGKCQDHQKEPEVIEEENWFFRLSRYAKRIERAIDSDKLLLMPEGRKNETLSFIRSGLEDVSISRPGKDISWGIPVPGDTTQTIYVWLEALTSYISSIGYGQDNAASKRLFRKWWPADTQIIGKDNLRFHAAIWPGMLFSAKLSLPKRIFVHGFVNVGGRKISKTVGNAIPPEELIKKYGSDAVRYYFLREFPSHEDGDFSYKKFEERYNADLAKGLGNLVARVITLALKLKIKNEKGKTATKNFKIIDQSWNQYRKSLAEFRFNDALAAVWSLISWCDRYIDRERPWEKSVNQPLAISDLLFALAHIASMLQPFLPETSLKIFKQLGINPTDKEWKFSPQKGQSLFPRLE